ncbi:hypothetical protein [Streptomyces sp. NPDC091209]|uniref:hypothetical protein n=1 Tax=Streptomyces sp. NPDC091209 TaxID=3365974 RepID=UPI003808CF76
MPSAARRPGQILALLVVTLIGVPLSDGAIPPEALPAGLDTLGRLLPARHVVEGTRSLLFYGGDAPQVTTAWLAPWERTRSAPSYRACWARISTTDAATGAPTSSN